MISFPRFGQYTSDSYVYSCTSPHNSNTSSYQTSSNVSNTVYSRNQSIPSSVSTSTLAIPSISPTTSLKTTTYSNNDNDNNKNTNNIINNGNIGNIDSTSLAQFCYNNMGGITYSTSINTDSNAISNGSGSVCFMSDDDRFKIRKSRKSKKSILMDLLYTSDEDTDNNNDPLGIGDENYVYFSGNQPRLAIPSHKLSRSDPNYDLQSKNFPSMTYVSRYFAKLGLPNIDGKDIKKPYDFGYYSISRKSIYANYNKYHDSKKPRAREYDSDTPSSSFYRNINESEEDYFSFGTKYLRKQSIISGASTGAISAGSSPLATGPNLTIHGRRCSNLTSVSSSLASPNALNSTKHQQRKIKRILKYGARCGHCHKFIRVKNESAEGGFLSYIGYFRHWVNHHYDER